MHVCRRKERKNRWFTYTNKSPRDWELSAIKNDANKNLRTKSPNENTERVIQTWNLKVSYFICHMLWLSYYKKTYQTSDIILLLLYMNIYFKVSLQRYFNFSFVFYSRNIINYFLMDKDMTITSNITQTYRLSENTLNAGLKIFRFL